VYYDQEIHFCVRVPAGSGGVVCVMMKSCEGAVQEVREGSGISYNAMYESLVLFTFEIPVAFERRPED
jgi:hypothetical protein